jgi:hypothetical protein
MSTTLAENLRRVAAQHRICCVSGCSQPVRRLGRYCGPHQQHVHRHGEPCQTPITIYRLKPYQKRVASFLKKNRQHPAVQAVIDKLSSLLATAASKPVYTKPRRGDFRTQALMELQRLHAGGTTGEEMLSRLLAIAYMAHSDPALLQPLSIGHRYAAARLTLNLRVRGTPNWKADTHLGGQVLNTIGQQLNSATVLLASEMLKAFDQADREPVEYRETITKAVETQPLVAPK